MSNFRFRYLVPFLVLAALMALTYGLTQSSQATCTPNQTKDAKAAEAQDTKKDDDKKSNTEEKEDKKMSHATIVSTTDFEQEVLQSKQPVLVDFFADWCTPCKMLAPTIDELAAEYDGKAKVVKVNTDQSQQIAAKYGIRGIPTIIVFKNGEPVDRSTGVQPKSDLAKKLDNAIKN